MTKKMRMTGWESLHFYDDAMEQVIPNDTYLCQVSWTGKKPVNTIQLYCGNQIIWTAHEENKFTYIQQEFRIPYRIAGGTRVWVKVAENRDSD